MKRAKLAVPKDAPQPIRIDIGCGKRPKEGFDGVDAIDFGQKYVLDVAGRTPKFNNSHDMSKPHGGAFKAWPWKNNSIDEVHSSHFLEHLTGEERIHFFNELYRVMKPGSTATIITPHWAHECAYGDPTHQWPPMSPWYRLYLCKTWRDGNAPHTSYTCDFNLNNQTLAGSWDGRLETRNQEFREAAMQQQINAWRDLIVTLKK
jgi:hypothetical protein